MSKNLIEELVANTPRNKINEISIFPHTVWIDSINIGLASPVNANYYHEISNVGHLHEMDTLELAQFALSQESSESSIGMASINSSLDLESLKNNFIEANAFEILLNKGASKNVSIIGNFPWVKKLRERKIFNNLWVFELRPKDPEDLPSELIPQYLPKSDIVLLSGTTIINHTFMDIRQHFHKSYNIMLGPSTPLSTILFNYGLDMLCGSLVTDKHLARLWLSQGARFREAQGLMHVALAKD